MSEKPNLKPLGHDLASHECHKEAVCINVNKIYDACREKDCLEDLRVILTRCGQNIVDNSINVKVKSAEVIWVFTDIEPVPFNRGYFTVDIKYFFSITLDVFTGVGRPVQVEGLATFDKRAILFGSEGNCKTFSSKYRPGTDMPILWPKNNLPTAVVEVVDPIALSAKVVERKHCHHHEHHHHHHHIDLTSIPHNVCQCFDDDLVFTGEEEKQVFVTLGVFTIVRIERNVQLLMPAYDFCVPVKECHASTDDDPCKLFNSLKFPVDEFFPPERMSFEHHECHHDHHHECHNHHHECEHHKGEACKCNK